MDFDTNYLGMFDIRSNPASNLPFKLKSLKFDAAQPFINEMK